MKRPFLLVLLASLNGCSATPTVLLDDGGALSDASSAADGALQSDAGATDGSTSQDTSVTSPCACPANQGCVHVKVTRDPNASFPWTQWPDKADGTGPLIISAYNIAKKTIVQERIGTATFTSATAAYEVNLLCADPGESYVNAYLDDNLSVPAGANYQTAFSSDYPDSCAYPRSQKFTIIAGQILEAPMVLGGSCD